MFNKKIIFIVFLLIIAIGTVSATDLNSTDDTADEDMVLEVSSNDLTFSTDLKMTENDSVSSGDDALGDVQTQGDYLNTHIVSGSDPIIVLRQLPGRARPCAAASGSRWSRCS